LVTGMNERVLLVENAGYIAENLLLVWTLFLPLGDRFSVDAWLASRRAASAETHPHDAPSDGALRTRAPFTTLASLAVMLQLALLYYESWVHKTGDGWRDGHALHAVLHCDRYCTPFAVWLREHLPNWLDVFLSHSALLFEALVPFVILCPFARVWLRR